MSSLKRNSVIREEFSIGSRVLVNNELSGTIQYLGITSFQTGQWVGIELDEPLGKNSGVVQGKRYFECKTNHGVFVRPTNVKLLSTSIEVPPTTRRKSVVSTQRRSTITPRKSVIPSSTSTTTTAQSRKSIIPSAPQSRKSSVPASPTTAQRRKSIVSPTSPLTPKSRPTSLLQSSLNPTSKSTIIPLRKSTVPSSSPTTTRRARSNTQSLPPSSFASPSILKKPMTAPSTPDQVEETSLDDKAFDQQCQENTIANAAIISSPISIEKEEEESEVDIEEEQQQRQSQQQILQPYGSLASSRPISKSEQVRDTPFSLFFQGKSSDFCTP
ncbi:MAG: hypothetical protein EXX96DRAFT_107703 [Benjaminiella poitrasii]|nr:MAG: hypothetical protein EXX96DRAFT_107703 [Benjaminiella poitrasii]